MFKDLIKDALKKKGTVNVVDLFAVPDYSNYFKGSVDPNYARLFKGEWTSLQVSFEAVEICDRYPLGVKTTYRAYSKVWQALMIFIRDC